MRKTRNGTAWLAGHLGAALVLLGVLFASITAILRRSSARPQIFCLAVTVLAVLFTGASQLLCLGIICERLGAESQAEQTTRCLAEPCWSLDKPAHKLVTR